MNTNTIAKTSQIVFALVMAIFGLFHFMGADGMAGYVPAYIPGGVIWVYITGLGLVGAGVSMIIGKYTKLACYLLGAMLLIFVVTLHLPGYLNAVDAAAKQAAMPGLLKDIALAAAAFFVGAKNA